DDQPHGARRIAFRVRKTSKGYSSSEQREKLAAFDVHSCVPAIYARPITRSENQVAISGKRHNSTIDIVINTTNGITPQTTSRSGISGAMLLMTKMFSPTGG